METAQRRRRRGKRQTNVGGAALSRLRAFVPLLAILLALVGLAIGGGSNRTDAVSLIYMRPVLVIVLMALTLVVDPARLVALRWPLGLLALALLIGVVQLVPLPPGAWMALPGHAMAAAAAHAAGVPQPWRPISLTPDLTLQALLWFLAPTCALLGWAVIPAEQRKLMLMALLIVGLISAMAGAIQVSTGSLYIYQWTYEGNAVGLLANRNHQGALLAAMFPMLRVFTLLPTRSTRSARRRLITAGVVAVLLVPMILLTASRAALALLAVGLVTAAMIAPARRRGTMDDARRQYLPWVLMGAIAAIVVVVVLFGRAAALDRLFALNAVDDLRFSNTPQVLRIIRMFFPVGSGLGSFDPVFRIFEPDNALSDVTYNHAHNDFFEVALTSGIAGIGLMVIGLGWWLAAGWRVFRRSSETGLTRLMGCAGWSLMLVLMLASTVDYPLRTPLMGFIFALAAAWLAEATSAPAQNRHPALQAGQASY